MTIKTLSEKAFGWLEQKSTYVIVVAMITAIGSVGVASYEVFGVEKRNDYQFLIDNLRLEVIELRKRVDELTKINIDLQSSILLLKSTTDEAPVPAWIKGKDGRYKYFNQAYEREIYIPNGIDPSKILGRTDFEIFGIAPNSIEWRKNDSLAMILQERVIAIEPDVKIHGTDWLSVKYPIYSNIPTGLGRREVVGTGGFAIRLDENGRPIIK